MQPQQSSSTFDRNNFASKLCEKLLAFSENGQFSDICLIASDDVKFHTHKCVLSASSEYFMAMFGGTLKEASSSEVKIHEINGKSLKPILTFLYTGHIDLQGDTIKDILRAANYFQIQLLIKECYNFMGTKLDAKNCLGILMFADQHEFIELFGKASKFASGIFETISNEKDFLKLDENQLISIVSSEDLCVTSEEKVFVNLIKWIDHDKPNREKSTLKLFSKVRYWLLSPVFIKQQRCKLPNQIEFLEMFCTWLEWHSSPVCQRAIKSMGFSKPKMPHGILLVGGGKIQTFDPNLNIWTIESFSNLPDRFDGVVAHGNKLIFSIRDTLLPCFDLQTHEITKLPKMRVPHYNFCLAVLNDELFAIGGGHRVVEKYIFSTDKWQDVTPMNTLFPQFCSSKVAVANGILYVVGDSLTMDCYNPVTNDWTTKRIADNRESDYGFTDIKGKLYKIGGLQQIQMKLRTCDTIHQLSNDWTWTNLGQMKIGLSDMHCVSLNDRLFTLGGLDDTKMWMNLFQEYDPNTKKWKLLPQVIEYNTSKSYGLVALK